VTPNLAQSSPAESRQRVPEPERLEPDTPIAREIAAGGSQKFVVSLTRRQYVRVVVDQSSVDVSLELLKPDGERLLLVDRVPRNSGDEEVQHIADSSGDYAVLVRVADGSPGGRYAIKAQMREASERDQNLVAGFRAFSEAYKLGSGSTEESFRQAISKYQESLTFWRAARDASWEAETLALIGVRYSWLSDFDRALDSFKQALRVAETAGDQRRQSVNLNNIASVLEDAGQKEEAAEYYKRSAAFFHAAGDNRREATALNNIALLYKSIGKPHDALEHFGKALDLSRLAGDRSLEGIVLYNMGTIHHSLGNPEQPITRYYADSLAVFRKLGDPGREAILLTTIGMAYGQTGEHDKALENLTRALELHRTGGNRSMVAVSLNNIGGVYRARGDLSRALDYFEQALSLRREVGDRSGEAVTLSNIGMVHHLLGKLEEATGYLEKALAVQQADALDADSTFFKLAKVHLDRGNLDAASQNIDRAISLRESVRAGIRHRQLRTSYFAELREYYQLKIGILMRQHRDHPDRGYDAAAFATSEKARARILLEVVRQTGEVQIKADQALLNQRRELHQRIDRAAMARQAILSRKHTDDELSVSSRAIDDLIDRLEFVEGQLKYADASYNALVESAPLGLEEIQQSAMGSNTILLEYALGENESYLWALSQEGLSSYQLPRRQVIEDLARRVYALLTEPNRRPANESIPARRARLSQAEAEYPKAASELAEILLGPVAPILRGQRLLIVAEGALQYVPFAALPLPASATKKDIPVLVEHEVVSIPSGSILATMRKQWTGRTPAPKMVAIIADPVFSLEDWRVKRQQQNLPAAQALQNDVQRTAQDSGALDASSRLPRLPLTRSEAEAISSLSPPGQSRLALDFEATREAAVDHALADYRIVHFATHGLLNSSRPELSGLVFSLVDRNGQPRDGFLRLHEIYNLNLPAELVVLSACQTALGKEVKGEGLAALTRGFMHAGAARVLASLWKIDDRATSVVMKRFYEGMLGSKRMRPAAALRSAQIELWKSKRWRSPHYWGAYVMQGDWS
jgi:CHAT domain-containing protein/tetratricopeptide (TPR) repeat protein